MRPSYMRQLFYSRSYTHQLCTMSKRSAFLSQGAIEPFAFFICLLIVLPNLGGPKASGKILLK